MTDTFKKHIENALGRSGDSVGSGGSGGSRERRYKIVQSKALGGGSISNTFLLTTQNDVRLLLKYNKNVPNDFFEAEKLGLLELEKQSYISSPKVLYANNPQADIKADIKDNPPFIIMEYIESKGEKEKGFFENFGRGLALMHKEIKSDKHGFYKDNYIGSTKQCNTTKDNWHSFFKENRLKFQIELAKKNRHWDNNLERLWLSLENKLELIIPNAKPSLLHGDLWAGNYIIGTRGEALIIDPALYYGAGECDLAMTSLFGGFEESFYDAYKEIIPLDKDYKERSKIYNLYHLLNHLNIFGTSYKGAVKATLKHFI